MNTCAMRSLPMTVLPRLGVLALACLLGSGCTPKQQGAPRLKTTPVTGTVVVDGEPAVGLTVEFHPQSDVDTIKFPVLAMTDQEGNFSLTMYETGDGIPEGTYKVTFVWDANLMRKDKLNGAYADPKKSDREVMVVSGEPTDLGVIELSVKGPD